MKQYAQPNAAEVTKYERYINETLWGSVQLKNGVYFPNYCMSRYFTICLYLIGSTMFAVRKSGMYMSDYCDLI